MLPLGSRIKFRYDNIVSNSIISEIIAKISDKEYYGFAYYDLWIDSNVPLNLDPELVHFTEFKKGKMFYITASELNDLQNIYYNSDKKDNIEFWWNSDIKNNDKIVFIPKDYIEHWNNVQYNELKDFLNK